MTSFRHPAQICRTTVGKALGDGAWSEMILGDLHEETARACCSSKPRAACWYWRQVLRLGTMGSRPVSVATGRRASDAIFLHYHLGRLETLSCERSALEVRHACRSILKRPAMSAIVVVTLALGLGANAAVFAMIDALVLRPFTMPDVDRITPARRTAARETLSGASRCRPPTSSTGRQQADVFERLAAFAWWNANLVGRDEPENVQGFFVSADFFPVLGVQPALGRSFLADEETHGRHRRVVLGHGLWQRRFASDPAIVGRSIDVDGAQYEVVGIAPPAFDFPMGAELWAPLAFDAEGAANRRSPLPHRDRAARARAHARRRAGADGRHRRTAAARASGDQSRPRVARLHARATA